MQSKKLAKSGDFFDTGETLLSTLGGNMSNLMCAGSKLDSNKSLEIGKENLTPQGVHLSSLIGKVKGVTRTFFCNLPCLFV